MMVLLLENAHGSRAGLCRLPSTPCPLLSVTCLRCTTASRCRGLAVGVRCTGSDRPHARRDGSCHYWCGTANNDGVIDVAELNRWQHPMLRHAVAHGCIKVSARYLRRLFCLKLRE
ncbi:hypothetical protein NOCARDAX2BIS_220169 [Nocardioides sp. AX2bis]|nr:hypothetical protein NOCARDAX2BIS_220169 [Nocardioides sp. AX2bis]